MKVNRSLFLVLFLYCSSVSAFEMELREHYEQLTNGYDHWRSHVLAFNHQMAPRKTVYGQLQEVERFSIIDSSEMMGIYWPLSAKWTLQLEKQHSSEDQFNILPQSSHMFRLHSKLPEGWGVALAQRDTRHSLSDITNMTLEVENYFVRLYSLYRYSSGDVAGAGTTESHSIQMRYIFSSKLYLGYGTGFGKEVEKADATTILTSTVFHLFINGLYMVNDKVAITGVVSLNKQGDLYQREGVEVGLRYRF